MAFSGFGQCLQIPLGLDDFFGHVVDLADTCELCYVPPNLKVSTEMFKIHIVVYLNYTF